MTTATCDRCGKDLAPDAEGTFLCPPCDQATLERACSLCTEWFPKSDLNEHGECFECVDHANATWATGA